MGLGLPFRPASFDGAISISALQWLCYSESSDQVPRARLMRFFSSLYTILKRSARAILQFYPQNAEQAILIASCATRVGFAGGLLVDFPNSTKAKKYYLCLSFEQGYAVPKALGAEEGVVAVGRETKQRGKGKHRVGVKSREWILQKKERDRKRGKEVRPDSKYTGRKRRSAL
jgi:18S rRNA (guanine1575-N7)-methyltransferase